MALEPRDVDRRRRAEPRARRHDAAVLDRRWRSPLPVVALAMGGACLGLTCTTASPRSCRTGCSSRSRRRSCCGPAGRSSSAAGHSVVNRNLNMFTLIALGTGAAYALQRRRDARARHVSRRRSAAMTARSPVYFEAAAVITVLVLLGQVLELRAREQTGGAIRALLDLAPKTARRIVDRRRRRGRAARRGRRSATGCACGPARRCRSTASCSRAAAPSTSRW